MRPYPFINGPDDFSSPSIRAVLDRHGAFLGQPNAVRASVASSIRRFVAPGPGIALVPAVPAAPPHPGFFERTMSRYFGHIPVYLVHRRGASIPPAGEALLREIRVRLGSDTSPGA